MKKTVTNNELIGKLNMWLRHHQKDVNAFCAFNHVNQQSLFETVDEDKFIETYSL